MRKERIREKHQKKPHPLVRETGRDRGKEKERVRETEKERERETEIETEKERETDRQTDKTERRGKQTQNTPLFSKFYMHINIIVLHAHLKTVSHSAATNGSNV